MVLRMVKNKSAAGLSLNKSALSQHVFLLPWLKHFRCTARYAASSRVVNMHTSFLVSTVFQSPVGSIRNRKLVTLATCREWRLAGRKLTAFSDSSRSLNSFWSLFMKSTANTIHWVSFLASIARLRRPRDVETELLSVWTHVCHALSLIMDGE